MPLCDEKQLAIDDEARQRRLDGYLEDSARRAAAWEVAEDHHRRRREAEAKLRRELCLPPEWPDEGWR
jgi:hypothetical protein